MGTETKILWTDSTFNPWIGCSKVSDGCKHCYAEALDHRLGHGRWGAGKPRHKTSAANWKLPLKWDLQARKDRRRHRVFCASLADVFDAEVDEAWRAELFELIRITPSLDWLLLTKRPENIPWMLPVGWGDGVPNVWLGTSVENQETADLRIPLLSKVPARVRFLSIEPLLGPVELNGLVALKDYGGGILTTWLNIHWIIVGGESGAGARPFELAWARSILKQCKRANVRVFVKQLGAAASDPENGLAGHALKIPSDAQALIARRLVDRKGGDIDEWPEDLRVREFPAR